MELPPRFPVSRSLPSIMACCYASHLRQLVASRGLASNHSGSHGVVVFHRPCPASTQSRAPHEWPIRLVANSLAAPPPPPRPSSLLYALPTSTLLLTWPLDPCWTVRAGLVSAEPGRLLYQTLPGASLTLLRSTSLDIQLQDILGHYLPCSQSNL
jgi:hypothetical protein